MGLRIAFMLGAIVHATVAAGGTIEDQAEKQSLESLIQVAVRVAPELQSAAFDVATARATRISADATEDTDVLVTANGTRSYPSDASNSLPLRSESVVASLSRRLPTNGVLTLSSNFSHRNSIVLSAGGQLTTEVTTSNLNLQLVQPLLQNVGASVEKVAIRQAEHQLSAATIRRSATARLYVAKVVEAYWRLALAWRQLDVRQRGLEQAKQQLVGIQRGLKSGAIARSEALPFEQSIASRQIDIANGERDIVEQSIALRTLIGLEMPNDKIVIRTVELPKATMEPLDTSTLVTRALASSDDLKAAVEDLRSAEAGLAASDRNRLPRLDLTLSGGPTGSASLPNVAPGAATSALIHRPDYTASATLTFELPIGRDLALGTFATDRASVARASFNLLADRRTVAANTIQLVYDASTDARIVELAAEEVKIAEANVDAEQNKFENGHSTANEIVRRQADLEAARLQLEIANANYIIERTKIEAATGEILSHYNLRIGDSEVAVDAALAARTR